MNRHLGLFLLTALTTTAAGACTTADFLDAFGRATSALSWTQLALGGLWFSVPFLGFLTAHEFGHYCAARWHGLRPSLPYYLPAPLPLTGSLGAVIVFRGHFPNRRVLFDFAAGGPLAGFVVAVLALAVRPALVAGRAAAGATSSASGWATRCSSSGSRDAVAGPIRDGWSLNLHPTAFAGWLGLLFTMMNLVPISQLDGGHIAYAAMRRHSRWVTLAAFGDDHLRHRRWRLHLDAVAVCSLVIMRLVGWEHPAGLDDDLPLDPGRLASPAGRRDLRGLLHAGTALPARAERRPLTATSRAAAGLGRGKCASEQHHSIVNGSTSTVVRRASAGCCASARCTACRIAARFVPFRMTWTRKSPRSRGSGAAAGPSTS